MGFEKLVQRISVKLKGIAYKLNGRFTFFNNDDLYQEAMIHLWVDYKKGKLLDKTDSYILQGCYFYLKNYIRKNSFKAKFVSLERLTDEDEGSNFKDMLFLEGVNFENYFNNLNTKILLENIYDNGILNSKEKYILALCARGLTTREIGNRLSVSHVMVVKLVGRIRKKCKRYLDIL